MSFFKDHDFVLLFRVKVNIGSAGAKNLTTNCFSSRSHFFRIVSHTCDRLFCDEFLNSQDHDRNVDCIIISDSR